MPLMRLSYSVEKSNSTPRPVEDLLVLKVQKKLWKKGNSEVETCSLYLSLIQPKQTPNTVIFVLPLCLQRSPDMQRAGTSRCQVRPSCSSSWVWAAASLPPSPTVSGWSTPPTVAITGPSSRPSACPRPSAAPATPRAPSTPPPSTNTGGASPSTCPALPSTCCQPGPQWGDHAGTCSVL